MRLNLCPLPLLLDTNGLLLQWARSNMMPFYFALEANNLGLILDLFFALLLFILDFFFLLELNPIPPLSLGDFCTLKILLSVDFPS